MGYSEGYRGLFRETGADKIFVKLLLELGKPEDLAVLIEKGQNAKQGSLSGKVGEVAEKIGKRHDNLLRDIEKYIKSIDSLENSSLSSREYFIKSSYMSKQNKEVDKYLITKMGCGCVDNRKEIEFVEKD